MAASRRGMGGGPKSIAGKARVSSNRVTHGFLAARAILAHEDADEWQTLHDGLVSAMAPVGALEHHLLERVTMALWRDRRLVAAETAAIKLAQRQRTAQAYLELRRHLGADDMGMAALDAAPPTDAEREAAQWARVTLAEIDQLGESPSIDELGPNTLAQLEGDAAQEGVESYLECHEGGLAGYIDELRAWCRRSVQRVDAHPVVVEVASLIMDTKTMPSELLGRYQRMITGEVSRTLAEFRAAQAHRLQHGPVTEV